jgi:hypothetical protein
MWARFEAQRELNDAKNIIRELQNQITKLHQDYTMVVKSKTPTNSWYPVPNRTTIVKQPDGKFRAEPLWTNSPNNPPILHTNITTLESHIPHAIPIYPIHTQKTHH